MTTANTFSTDPLIKEASEDIIPSMILLWSCPMCGLPKTWETWDRALWEKRQTCLRCNKSYPNAALIKCGLTSTDIGDATQPSGERYGRLWDEDAMKRDKALPSDIRPAMDVE